MIRLAGLAVAATLAAALAGTLRADGGDPEHGSILRLSYQEDSPTRENAREEKPGGIPGLPPLADEPSATPRKADTDEGDDDGAGESLSTDEVAADVEDYQQPGNPVASTHRCRGGWLDGLYTESWLDQGATINTLSPRNRTNGPVTFNDRSNDYQLNQLYLRLARDVDQDRDLWDLGGHIDLLYGTDSIYTTARGLETFDDCAQKWNAQRYGLAMPQVYMEVFSPWGNGLSMKLGHFYAPMGYEVVIAPDNFFYSHSYVHQYGEPFTYTGLLGTSKLGCLTVQAGMNRGWDNWDDNNNDLGFMGGVTWQSASGRTSIALNVDAGRQQPDPGTNIRTVYSLVIQQKLGERWQYVIQHDLGYEPGAGVNDTNAGWYGVNQYLFRRLNDAWKAGMRFEWFRDENGSRVPGAGQTADYFELSAGANWTPNDRVVVRPELRWDWTGTPDYYPFGDGTRSNQWLLDCDVILRF